MTIRRITLCATAALTLGSCDVPTSPNDRVYLQLLQFETPDVAEPVNEFETPGGLSLLTHVL